MNTIGKPGKLGEQIRRVVSVSMLTEGWDANTVTHILGVRALRAEPVTFCQEQLTTSSGMQRTSNK